MTKEKKIVWVWRSILIFLCILFFAYLFQKNIPFDGRRILEYNFGEPSGEIGHLRPFPRVVREDNQDTKYVERIIESPIYLDVFSLVPFKKIHIELFFKSESGENVLIGVQRSVQADDIRVKPFSSIRKEGEWYVGTVDYTLSGIPLLRSGYILVLDTPKPLSETQTLRVSRIRIVLERDSLRPSLFIHVAQKIITRVFH